jgi:hypothetical protein
MPEPIEICIEDRCFTITNDFLDCSPHLLYTLVTNKAGYEQALIGFLNNDSEWSYAEINVLIVDVADEYDGYEALPLRVYINQVSYEEYLHGAGATDLQQEEQGKQRRILQFRNFIDQLTTGGDLNS